MIRGRIKHLLHCMFFLLFIFFFLVFAGAINLDDKEKEFIDPWENYGVFGALILYILRLLTLLTIPQVLCNFAGLTLFNAFPGKIRLKSSPLLAPFICIRVVTRGDFPKLVKDNVNRNMNKCIDVGMENFMIEVVTDKAINLPKHRKVREVVVPSDYQTKSGALFKARALQYCLEDQVNILTETDWIVHLDEETLLTENSLRGILNFVMDGQYQFGQGLITYANEQIVNWLTTLADSFRVADDMGKLRLQFYLFHKPLFSWKGSYVVTQVSAEKKVSFDNGLDGSVAEDCFFAMKAYKEGYTFNFVEGEMWEKSPFTLWDFMQQRKRWIQGILLVVHSKEIPLVNNVFLAISCYSWVTLPLSTSNVVLAALCPIPCPQFLDIACGFTAAVNIYMYIFGVIKSFPVHRFGPLKFILFVGGALATIPLNIVIENIAVIWGMLGKKHKFYIVNKEIKTPVTV
ncbi:glycosyltransferase isoform X1 [Bombyx mori]|uniref:Glycosyltransferase n=1 Tax=Bombyx mori TaxID=7091 RepID=G1UHW4_BOMMO|nr:glycosyltransferase precursor [Bombyx mori]XP_037870657.1 glycosyltransferase isoform X1 [Bombyx mori]XP_037870658.1 glycosyltransferase isoform X1 [Bombyx mori]BAK82123.1 glycosyltransferase [Bombyx mori]